MDVLAGLLWRSLGLDPGAAEFLPAPHRGPHLLIFAPFTANRTRSSSTFVRLGKSVGGIKDAVIEIWANEGGAGGEANR